MFNASSSKHDIKKETHERETYKKKNTWCYLNVYAIHSYGIKLCAIEVKLKQCKLEQNVHGA